ncbi:MAG TPA: sigma-70 family RNA polymerase sigma factor [Candidatus Angelobacter sp.]|nr:sigma-70 family RNA polymerase sigma factor [Candidatus Angelobacter sp.]
MSYPIQSERSGKPSLDIRRYKMLEQVEITGLLHGIRNGDPDAENQLIKVVYKDLRKMARRYMAGERRNHTLQPTALVHEAYMRIFRGGMVDWQDRAHFLAVAAAQMKRVLIDHGRAFRGPNRGGDFKVALDETIVANPEAPCDMEVLKDLLERLSKTDATAAQVIELKFFGGLTDKEVAHELATSHSSVRRHWVFARAWMGKHLAANRNSTHTSTDDLAANPQRAGTGARD